MNYNPKQIRGEIRDTVNLTLDFLNTLSKRDCVGGDQAKIGIALSVIMQCVYDLAPTYDDARELIERADRIAFLDDVDQDELEQDQNFDPADLPRVTSRTRAPKSGRQIVCPCCGVSSRVYHFAWSGLQCNTCKTMTPKHDWIVA